MELSKIDLMIRNMILRHHSLYPNRFAAFAELMTNSCYEWNANGELEYIFQEEPASMEAMLAEFQNALAESKEKHNLTTCPACVVELNTRFITEDERKLHNAQFIAAHIDVYASTWCDTDYRQVWLWLFHTYRYGISKHWAINNKPANINEEWRLAIKDWLSQLMPPANSIMGMFVEVDGGPRGNWQALPGYEAVFNWVYETAAAYTTEADRNQQRHMVRIADDIVEGILREERELQGTDRGQGDQP
jgi:hypothetical protein